MANRYWVGGSGSWEDTLHWSAASAGSSGASLPTEDDNVYFDENSSVSDFTVTIGDNYTPVFSFYSNNLTSNKVLSIESDYTELEVFGNFESRYTEISSNIFVYHSPSFQNNKLDIDETVLIGGDFFIGFGDFPSYLFNDLSAGYTNVYSIITNGFDVNVTTMEVSGNNNIDISNSYIKTNTIRFNYLSSVQDLIVSNSTIETNNLYAKNNQLNHVILSGSTNNIYESSKINALEMRNQVFVRQGTTQLVEALSSGGTEGNRIVVRSMVDGSTYNIRKNSGNISVSFIDIKDSRAIGGAIFEAYRSIDSGNNTGWNFTGPTMPVAAFTYGDDSGKTPHTVWFEDASQGGIETIHWDFGDGNESTLFNPIHTYTAPGIYDVTLTVSNELGTDSIVGGPITVEPNIYNRSAVGRINYTGSAVRLFIANKTASGTIRYSGSASATVVKDPEALQGKTYLYKVYDENGDYLTTWKKIVISDPSYTHEINTIGSTMSLELAINSDSLDTVVQPLQTEAGQTITTENDEPILVATTTRNTIGDGTAINYNNRVDVYAFYGSVEPLLTENDEPIATEDGEVILAETGAPNGRRIFTGFISEINSRYGNTETTQIQLTSYGFDLDQYVLTDGSKTTVTMNSIDPTDIVRQAVTQFVSKSNAEQVTYTDFTDISIESTGTVVSYTFKSVTYADLLNKTLELMPSNWFYSVGLGDNTIYFSERSQTPHHKFYLGKHLEAVDLKGSIIESKNHVLFSGGEVSDGVSLYLEEKQPLSPRVRRGLSNMSDNRVTVMASAQLIAENEIDNLNKINYRTTIEVVSGQYDIESIRVGQVVGFRNFGNFVDDLTMQIIGLTYSPDTVQLQLESQPVSINKRIEDIRRNLTVTENQNQPDTPS